jgi:AcrR family transcriptional regulator|tara:strand:- start:1 stop:603 length:603 start_codon:yes stop_codon:yes gene_type:complete
MQYHHGNLKEHLIFCAYVWISTNGTDSISLRRIAKIAKVSQTAPYRHFDSKEHMLAEVATLGFEKFSSEMSNIKTTDNPADDLVKCGVTYIEFGLANEHIIDLMFHYPIKKTDFPDLLVSADKAFGMLLKRLQYLHEGNEDSVQLNSISMHAYVHGLLAIIRMNQRIDTSAKTTFFKASSTVKENLEKMLGAFVKSLDFS